MTRRPLRILAFIAIYILGIATPYLARYPLALSRPAISGVKEFSRETSPDGVLDAVVIQDSCPPRKLPVLRGYFHLFTLFDEKGNTDFYACLQLCCLGPAARRVAPNRWFRVGNLQLNEYWQL